MMRKKMLPEVGCLVFAGVQKGSDQDVASIVKTLGVVHAYSPKNHVCMYYAITLQCFEILRCFLKSRWHNQTLLMLQHAKQGYGQPCQPIVIYLLGSRVQDANKNVYCVALAFHLYLWIDGQIDP